MQDSSQDRSIPTRVGNVTRNDQKNQKNTQFGSSPPAWGTYFLNSLAELAEKGGGVVVAFGAGPALPVGIGAFGLAGLVDKVGGAMSGEGVEEALPIGEAEFDEAGGAVGEKGGGVWVVFGAGEGVVGCGRGWLRRSSSRRDDYGRLMQRERDFDKVMFCNDQ